MVILIQINQGDTLGAPGGQEISGSAGHPPPRAHGVCLCKTSMGKGSTEGLGKPLNATEAARAKVLLPQGGKTNR